MPKIKIELQEILDQIMLDKPECVQMAVLKVENQKLSEVIRELEQEDSEP